MKGYIGRDARLWSKVVRLADAEYGALLLDTKANAQSSGFEGGPTSKGPKEEENLCRVIEDF